jgi:hypothetical protein
VFAPFRPFCYLLSTFEVARLVGSEELLECPDHDGERGKDIKGRYYFDGIADNLLIRVHEKASFFT